MWQLCDYNMFKSTYLIYVGYLKNHDMHGNAWPCVTNTLATSGQRAAKLGDLEGEVNDLFGWVCYHA